MRLDQLIAYFSTSPAIRLLRAQHAPFIVDFLFQQFKASNKLSVPASELASELSEYQASIHETHSEALRDKPEQYLVAWSSGETRWVHRFVEGGRNEPVYQLTAHTEEVFVYLDRALQKDLGFVGTESRLRLVISTLADLVTGASRDPDVRLAHLRAERQRIDDEIATIFRDGHVAARYEPAAIRERFLTAVALLKELLSDFRAVEDRFKEITRQVQRRHMDGRDSRGSILEYALDAEDVLKKDDQGVSFYEFVRFILSPKEQEKLRGVISELGRIEELTEQTEGLTTVRRMVRSLIADAEKVMRTNQRLSATLRRLLDSRAAHDRRRLTHLLGEIRALAAQMAVNPPREVGMEVDIGVTINAPFSRSFWSPPTTFTQVEMVEHEVNSDRRLQLFEMLAQMHRLDWRRMREHVRYITRDRTIPSSLGELVREFPPAAGIIELLGYLQIAKDDGHIVSRDKTEQIELASADGSGRRSVTVPLVLFIQSREAENASV